MVERSDGSGGSIIDGREYANHPGLFSYGSSVAEVRVAHDPRKI